MSGDVRWTVAVSAAAWIGLVIVVFRIVPPVVRGTVRLVRAVVRAAPAAALVLVVLGGPRA